MKTLFDAPCTVTKQCYGIYEHKLKSSVNMEETFQLTEDDLARVEGAAHTVFSRAHVFSRHNRA